MIFINIMQNLMEFMNVFNKSCLILFVVIKCFSYFFYYNVYNFNTNFEYKALNKTTLLTL